MRGRENAYGYCDIDSTNGGSVVPLTFYLSPDKRASSPRDNDAFEEVTDGRAHFLTIGEKWSCSEGETIPVGRGFADCVVVDEEQNRFTVRLYVGTPPD